MVNFADTRDMEIMNYAVLSNFITRIKFTLHNCDVRTLGAGKGEEALWAYLLCLKVCSQRSGGREEVLYKAADQARPRLKKEKREKILKRQRKHKIDFTKFSGSLKYSGSL
jgi:hypothetical protein